MSASAPALKTNAAADAERRWALISVSLIVAVIAVIAFTGIHWASMPPSGIEPIDPTSLHVAGEFVEQNLGAEVRNDGTVLVRLIGQQYSFNPQCVTLPVETSITFRGTSADVVHGFLVTGTNANAMLIPGYITTFTTRFSKLGDQLMPCHEFCGTGHAAMWAHIYVSCRAPSSIDSMTSIQARAVIKARHLVLAHFWSAFAVFIAALLLGEWQMVMRSPLHTWISIPEHYYRSVTGHGTVMAYVFPMLVAMGFGYAIVELSLKQALVGLKWAWFAFALAVAGASMAAATIASGGASVLYTFYPPLIGSPFYYLGIVLVVVGSWIWVALMAINLRTWRKRNVGTPVPLAMYANVAGAYLWAWTAIGAALEILFQILPVAFGFKSTIDAGLARVLFSWTLHAIVYFWLMPTYIAFYVIVPRAIGGRLYSDVMARLSFALFLVFAMPIGIHHLFADPEVGSGFKYVHTVFTGMVVIPTLLTVFTICASVELAARMRGGKGLFGWIRVLPWGNPAMLGLAFSFLMLGIGGAGGIINMSYQMNSTIHNTQWVTGHFHLIFAGAVVIMYFIIAYDLWPHLTSKTLGQASLIRWQLWLWFIGTLVMTLPWHLAGVLGMPRRMAYSALRSM